MKLKKLISLLLSLVIIVLSFQTEIIYAATSNYEEPTKGSDGYYIIGSVGNYMWFADSVNNGSTNINARLNTNIDLSNTKFTAIGTQTNPFKGTFDGCGYTITVNQKGSSDVAPFGRIGSCNIKNLIVEGTINTDTQFAAGIAMQVLGSTTANIENCISSVIISSSISGDGTHGGIVGVVDGTVNINNCAFTGTMTGSATNSCGGLIGWTSGKAYINNSYVAADFSQISSTNGNTFSRNPKYVTLKNCYYLNKLNTTPSDAVQKNEEQFASGEVCYFLNSKVTDGSQAWYQKLGTDNYPKLSGETVYYSYDPNQGKKVYSNTYTECTGHIFINGICPYCDEYETPTLVDGVYQLSNYGNLVWFSQYIDSGNNRVNAVLTADIVANENLIDESGNVSGTPEYTWNGPGRNASSSNCYKGVFDGNGHTISGLYAPYKGDYCGLFVKCDGTIKNLGVIDSFFGGSSYHTATFVGVGYSNSVIENCFSAAIINGTSYCGGIAGQTYGKINNCYFMGKITADKTYSNSIVSDYYNRGTLENCYYLSDCNATSTRATAKTAEQLKSGEVCYLLNNKVTDGSQTWYQTLGVNDYPVFAGKTVYYYYDETQDKNVYSNKYATACSHTFSNGICSKCGDYEEPTKLSSNYYLISNEGNYMWFAENTNYGNIFSANLGVDIDLSDITFTSIGTQANPFRGTFNGCGYTITVNQTNSNDVALFGRIGDCSIKNLSVKGTINTNTQSAAGIAMQVVSGKKANIENCVSSVTIASSISGEGTHGGIVGIVDGTANINNCAFTGAMTGSNTDSCGGLIGWTSGNSNISNSYVFADFSQIDSTNGNTFSRTKSKSKVDLTNCYYLNGLNETPDGANKKTEEQFAKGEVCYLLNNKVIDGSQAWYQKLGVDRYPKLNGESSETVYYCYDETQDKKIYSNTYIECTNHIYENGICQKCDGFQEPEIIDEAYQLSNYGNLMWFQEYVNKGNININAVLVKDITANENLLGDDGNVIGTPKYTWIPISNVSYYSAFYQGVFDGNGHTISGLYAPYKENYCGLFARCNGTIKNLGIIDSFFDSSNHYYTASFVGFGDKSCTIGNCFSTATINGEYYCGGIAGETCGKINNCYFMGKITANNNLSNSIASDYYNNGTLENCYYLKSCGLTTSRATGMELEQFASGEVCYLLQSGNDSIRWVQNIAEGNMPIPLADESLRVYKVTIVNGTETSAEYTNCHYTLPIVNEGYWIDDNGENLSSNINLTKDINITFKSYVALLGDADGNGEVNLLDTITILRHIANDKEITSEILKSNCDVNKDGVINNSDVAVILRHITNIQNLDSSN